jgi:CRP-like cAMP-binding protein
MRIPHEQVRKVMREFPAIAEAFARYLISDAAITNEWLVNVGSRQAKESVAHLFCEMAVRLGKATGERFSFSLPLSQLQLAEICGISVVHINRSMSALRHDGLMHMERGHIQIADWSGLKRLAGFDDLYLKASSLSRLAN